jgi:LuxR family transcriptional regulator, maltose regulon positive regulatory protein
MAWKTPLVSEGVLRVPLDAITITIGSAAWYTWLADETHCSFTFSHRSGDFTARKERKQRGQHYWIDQHQLALLVCRRNSERSDVQAK